MSSSTPLVRVNLHASESFLQAGSRYRHTVPKAFMAGLTRNRRDTSATSLQYTRSTSQLLRPYRSVSSSLYLTVATSTGTNTPTLSLSHLQGNGQQGCFQLHLYQIPNPTQSGILVTIQAPNSNYFISTSNNTLSLTAAQSSETPSSVQTIDTRFFYIQSSEGDARVTIKSAITGHYLSSSGSTLSLVSRPTGTNNTELFEVLECTQHDHSSSS